MALLVSGPSLSSHVVLPYSVQAVPDPGPGEGDWGESLSFSQGRKPGKLPPSL